MRLGEHGGGARAASTIVEEFRYRLNFAFAMWTRTRARVDELRASLVLRESDVDAKAMCILQAV
jgi:hypothetical protein